MSQNKVEMESDPFNQQFKVITSDDELAFYILTPQFMEHIVAADEKVDGYTKIEFENSRVTKTDAGKGKRRSLTDGCGGACR